VASWCRWRPRGRGRQWRAPCPAALVGLKAVVERLPEQAGGAFMGGAMAKSTPASWLWRQGSFDTPAGFG